MAGSASLGDVAIFSSVASSTCTLERLRDMTVHAGLSAFLDLLGEGLSGHCDDADVTAWRRQRTNPTRRLQPVYTRHPHIHQDNVETTARRRLHRCGTVVDADHVMPRSAEETAGNVAVHRFVVDDKDPKVRSVSRRCLRGLFDQ